MLTEKEQLQPQLSKLVRQLDGASEIARELVHGLLPDQLNLRPEAGRWSIAECLVHLNLSSAAFIPPIAAARDEAQQKQMFGAGPYKLDGMGRLLKWTWQPPPRLRSRTREQFEPVMIGLPEEVLGKFLSAQEQLRALMMSTEGLDLNKLIVSSPFSKRIRYNLFSCFTLIITHQLRHLWQAEQVKRFVLRER